MKVYVLIYGVDYEGESILGVFRTLEEAMAPNERYGSPDYFGIYEYELGEAYDAPRRAPKPSYWLGYKGKWEKKC